MPNKIMIVDDMQAIREVLKKILLKANYQVMTAASGEDALDRCRRFKPDLMLLDVVMPGIDGYEVCRRLRADKASSFMKIVMISGAYQAGKRLEGYDAGADDFVSKPFDEEELLAKVRGFLRLKAVEDKLRELNDTLNEQVDIRTRQLLDAEKMAAIGRHAAGIIHNLNNPLCSVMATAQLLALKYPDDKHIMLLRKAAGQMARIVKTILTTGSRESGEAPVRLDMNEILRDQVELMSSDPYFKNEIRVELALEHLPVYYGVYVHFSQSFGNLIKNAADAMFDSPEKVLTISTAEADGAIVIRIADTGHGIPEDRIVKIFDPFFTTKPLIAEDGRPVGTGLGLASCKEMIESYGGEIAVDSTPQKGTCFTVRLPLAEQAKDAVDLDVLATEPVPADSIIGPVGPASAGDGEHHRTTGERP